MPFAVFRRHQRKLLAVFAILAMFLFVVGDSVPRLISGGYTAGGNPVVATLYGKSIRSSDIREMAAQRNTANLFMSELTMLVAGRPVQSFFGELNTKAIVDALILEHEADKLGMPAGPDVARSWLKQRAGALMTKELFELILSRFNNKVSGEQLLSAIANQIRLVNVRQLLGTPVVTPFDVFQTYRDQNERVSARSVGFRVEDYLSKVGEPSSATAVSYYEKYKDQLPDPARPTPGFKVPRQVEVEILSIDGEALARGIKDALTEPELLAYFENRKADFKKHSEFPDEIFLGAPGLTPPLYQSFSEVRPYLATSLAEERAQAEIIKKFDAVKDEALIPFADKYFDAADELAEARKQGTETKATLPKSENLATLAKKYGLEHEITRLLTRETAEHYGLVSAAEVGLTRLSGGRKFGDEMFDPKSSLFEPAELTDLNGRRFLVRKLQDQAPRVPSLDEIRPEVILAWKSEQARPLAEKAARDYSEVVKAAGGKIEAEVVEGHPVITTDLLTKLQPGMPIPGQFFQNGPAVPAEIHQIPNAGPALRDAYFDLHEGEVRVAPNQPETVYYVLTLKNRIPATFGALYAPNGDLYRYRSEALSDAYKKRDEDWMNSLRTEAGLKTDWVPGDEAKGG
jgi:peptidyl-prolyl cis-trans isomerase D